MSRRIESLLALGTLALSSCTVLYDPSKYWSDGGLTADAALDAPTEPPPDVFVPPGVDAALDAWSADGWSADGWSPDGFASDTATPELDAARPVSCPGGLDLALPTCSMGSGLSYCSPEGGILEFGDALAEAALPRRSAGYRLGMLGNAIDLTTDRARPGGGIVDHEMWRVGDTVWVAWADNVDAPHVARRGWSVGAPALGAVEELNLDAVPLSMVLDLGVNETHLALTFTDGPGTTAGVATCLADLVCQVDDLAVPATSPAAWVAATSAGFAVATPRADALDFEILGVSALTGHRGAGLPDSTGLRPTELAVAYTEGPSATATQLALDFTHGFALPISLGAERPRVTNADAPGFGLIAHIAPGTGGLDVETLLMSCATEACHCTDNCATDPRLTEAQIASDLPVIDWQIHNVDRYHRIAVLLIGDSLDGTRVVVAMWSVEGSPLTPADVMPAIIASGRLSPTAGVGRRVRSVVRRDEAAGLLEVFVSTLVSLGGNDHIFLSGLRLLSCGL